MSLSQGRRCTRLNEIGGPVPVPYLRHILQVLADIFMVLEQLVVEHVDCIRGLNPQPWNMPQRLESKMKEAHLIQNDHVKWRSGGSAVHVAAHMEAAFISTSVNHAVDEPPVVVECEHDGCLLGEKRVERHVVHPMWMAIRHHQGGQIDHVDDPNLNAGDVLLEKPRGCACFDSRYISGASHHDIRFSAIVVRSELPDRCTS